MLTLATVRTGTKYGPEYVERLVRGVRRNLSVDRVICITDQPEEFEGVERVQAMPGLDGWWAKMMLFAPEVRGRGQCVYLDLDSTTLGSLAGLAVSQHAFEICANFTRTLERPEFPCTYGSCAMFFADGWGEFVWQRFLDNSPRALTLQYGDQQMIESIIPGAPLFQDRLPEGFFLNYRDFDKYSDGPPPEARLAIFGGPKKPHNYGPKWLQKEWER